MDVIALGNFVVGTWQGKTSFSFQCPSNRHVDLLPSNRRKKIDGPRINQAKIGRNSQCPCGSGKKYKRCCGKF
ncbi:MAG: SEC-C metal-binding domain-containing protein [Bacteroidetes bacterium]|nr:SEC-C metal-binding domain-containing protein [Bacteroidota bacterium]